MVCQPERHLGPGPGMIALGSAAGRSYSVPQLAAAGSLAAHLVLQRHLGEVVAAAPWATCVFAGLHSA